MWMVFRKLAENECYKKAKHEFSTIVAPEETYLFHLLCLHFPGHLCFPLCQCPLCSSTSIILFSLCGFYECRSISASSHLWLFEKKSWWSGVSCLVDVRDLGTSYRLCNSPITPAFSSFQIQSWLNRQGQQRQRSCKASQKSYTHSPTAWR